MKSPYLTTIFIYMSFFLLKASGQSLRSVEIFHGKLIMLGNRSGLSISYLGGLSRQSNQGGLFSEEIGKWRLHRDKGLTIDIAIVDASEKNAQKFSCNGEDLYFKFYKIDKLDGKVKSSYFEKVLRMKLSEFWKSMESEEVPWPKLK